jgi:hypothetical protein
MGGRRVRGSAGHCQTRSRHPEHRISSLEGRPRRQVQHCHRLTAVTCRRGEYGDEARRTTSLLPRATTPEPDLDPVLLGDGARKELWRLLMWEQ